MAAASSATAGWEGDRRAGGEAPAPAPARRHRAIYVRRDRVVVATLRRAAR